MMAQPIGTISLKQGFSIIGPFRPFQCAGRRRGHRIQCLMMALHPPRLRLCALDLQPSGGQVTVQRLGPRLGGFQPSPGHVERIPAQTHAPPDHHGHDQNDRQ